MPNSRKLCFIAHNKRFDYYFDVRFGKVSHNISEEHIYIYIKNAVELLLSYLISDVSS